MRLSKSSIGEREIEAVANVLRNEFLGMGPIVKQFENKLEEFFGGDMKVACLNTGTSALHAALLAIDLKRDDEVLVPSLTYLASYQAISATGAVPVSCDVDLNTGLLSLTDAELKLTSKTKAMMFVHYGSECGDVSAVYNFCKKHKLRLVEDAAHSFGCEYKGEKIGAMGDIVCFSFDGIKNITCAEGGAVVTRDLDVYERVKNIRLLGVHKDSENRYEKKRSWDFDVTEQGFRYHMGEMNAAIGLVQLERFKTEFREKRTALSQYYRQKFSQLDYIKPFESTHGQGGTVIVPHIMPVRVINGRRDELREYLQSHKVETGIHYKPSHLLSFYGAGKVKLPNVEKIYSEILTLPLQVDLKMGDIDQIMALLAQFK